MTFVRISEFVWLVALPLVVAFVSAFFVRESRK